MCRSHISIRLSIFIFCELVLQSHCEERRHNKCFDVDHKTTCYFAANDSRTDWDSAWRTCRNMNASLPVISSRNVQTLIENYLRDNGPDSCVWTAGRFITDNVWRWVNGMPLGFRVQRQMIRLKMRKGVQAILTKDLTYEASSSREKYDYLCQLSGVGCNGNNSIPWKNGCLIKSNNKLAFNEARRQCMEDGDDLATFSEEGDLQLLSTLLNRRTNYWIGLQQNLLIWNKSDTIEDIRYKLLATDDNTENGCLLLTVPDYEWTLIPCTNQKRFICQTVEMEPTRGENYSEKPSFNGIVVGVVCAALFIVPIPVIFILKRNVRKASAKADVHADIGKMYEDLRDSKVDPPITNVDNGFYMDLVPTQLGQNFYYYEDPPYEFL